MVVGPFHRMRRDGDFGSATDDATMRLNVDRVLARFADYGCYWGFDYMK